MFNPTVVHNRISFHKRINWMKYCTQIRTGVILKGWLICTSPDSFNCLTCCCHVLVDTTRKSNYLRRMTGGGQSGLIKFQPGLVAPLVIRRTSPNWVNVRSYLRLDWAAAAPKIEYIELSLFSTSDDSHVVLINIPRTANCPTLRIPTCACVFYVEKG